MWMELEIIVLSEVRQEWQTNIIWYQLYVESKKRIQINLFAEKKQTHRVWKTYGYQRDQVGGGRDGLGIWDWHMYNEVYRIINQ